MNTATASTPTTTIRLELGTPPKSSNTKDMTKGRRIDRARAARKAVAAAWFAFSLERFGSDDLDLAQVAQVQQRRGDRWSLRAIWQSPTPPRDQDNAAAALKPYVDACVQVVGRGRGGANKQAGEAPILIDDSDAHLAREIVIEKCAKGEESLVFEFSILEGGGQAPEADSAGRVSMADLQLVAELAGRPQGVKASEIEFAGITAVEGLLAEAVQVLGILVPRPGGLVFDAAAAGLASACQRADAWHLIESDPTTDELAAFCTEVGLEVGATDEDTIKRIAVWHRGQPALPMIRMVGELLASKIRGAEFDGAVEAHLEILRLEAQDAASRRRALEAWHEDVEGHAKPGQRCAWCAAICGPEAEGGLIVFEAETPKIFDGQGEAEGAAWACHPCVREIGGDLAQTLADVRAFLEAEKEETEERRDDATGLVARCGLALDVGATLAEVELALEGWGLEVEDKIEARRKKREGALPKWMTAKQLSFEGFEGPLPCYLALLKPAHRIEDCEGAIVLARHDRKNKDGSIDTRLAVAPLDASGLPRTMPPLGYELSLEALDPEQSKSPNDLPEESLAEVLSWWRAWVGSGHLMARTTEQRIRALDRQKPAIDAVREAEVLAAEADLEVAAAKKALKGAEAELERRQAALNKLVDEGQQSAAWPWPETD